MKEREGWRKGRRKGGEGGKKHTHVYHISWLDTILE